MAKYTCFEIPEPDFNIGFEDEIIVIHENDAIPGEGGTGGGVEQYANLASFPETGDDGILYVALDTNKTYTWQTDEYIQTASGSAQVQSDWDQADDQQVDFIKNKPTIPTLTVIINNQNDDYSLLATDKNKHIRMQKATASNLTIDDVFASGESCTVEQNGTGQVTFVAGSGVTIRSADGLVKTRVQYSGVTIMRTPTIGEYVIFGDLA